MRRINWSGFIWNVRSGSGGPGPNKWSDSTRNIWVDSSNRLHLKIIKTLSGWYCAEIYTYVTVGRGKYKFYMNSDPSNLADNVVAGLFYYLDDTNEIDIEFSRWNIHGTPNTQYTVQQLSGEGIESPRSETKQKDTVHSFIWTDSHISFSSKDIVNKGILSWLYNRSYLPKIGGRVHINLWLYKGMCPTNRLTQEIILSKIETVKEIPKM